MRKLETELGFYHSERLGLVVKKVYLPDNADENEFVFVSEEDGLKLLAHYKKLKEDEHNNRTLNRMG